MNTGISDRAFSMWTTNGLSAENKAPGETSAAVMPDLAVPRGLRKSCGLRRAHLAFAQCARGRIVGADDAVEDAIGDAMHDVLLRGVAARLVRAGRHALLHVRIDAEILVHDGGVLLVVFRADDGVEVRSLDGAPRERPVLV